jgi:hypothetical protein
MRYVGVASPSASRLSLLFARLSLPAHLARRADRLCDSRWAYSNTTVVQYTRLRTKRSDGYTKVLCSRAACLVDKETWAFHHNASSCSIVTSYDYLVTRHKQSNSDVVSICTSCPLLYLLFGEGKIHRVVASCRGKRARTAICIPLLYRSAPPAEQVSTIVPTTENGFFSCSILTVLANRGWKPLAVIVEFIV